MLCQVQPCPRALSTCRRSSSSNSRRSATTAWRPTAGSLLVTCPANVAGVSSAVMLSGYPDSDGCQGTLTALATTHVPATRTGGFVKGENLQEGREAIRAARRRSALGPALGDVLGELGLEPGEVRAGPSAQFHGVDQVRIADAVDVLPLPCQVDATVAGHVD